LSLEWVSGGKRALVGLLRALSLCERRFGVFGAVLGHGGDFRPGEAVALAVRFQGPCDDGSECAGLSCADCFQGLASIEGQYKADLAAGGGALGSCHDLPLSCTQLSAVSRTHVGPIGMSPDFSGAASGAPQFGARHDVS
jgi:hypothetical protein